MLIYQIYPRSFLDTNGDGIGDLNGITQKLPYIARLGADAVWISPFVKSPQKDFGYDVSDYRAIDPRFGTMADFKKLVARAHGLGLKIIMDQVWCHCSDQHPWFIESRKSRTNKKADWFVWVDATPDGMPPNNWLSYFGGPAWRWDTARQQYFFHQFLSSQPTFNLRNREVRRALLDIGRYWLKLGVDGFRLDAIHTGFADPRLSNNPARPRNRAPAPDVPANIPQARQIRQFSEGHADTLPFLEEVRAMANVYGAFLLGEVSGENPYMRAALYTAPTRLHTAYSFGLLKDRPSARLFKETVAYAETLRKKGKNGQPTYALSNHDVRRVVSRWGEANSAQAVARSVVRQRAERMAHKQIAKLGLLFGLMLPGHYCLYQGEELGLSESDVPYDKMVDPFGIAFYPNFKGRDGCRTPMPWTKNGKNGGFTQGDPWLPFEKAHKALAVDAQEKDKKSVLHFARALIAWRKTQPALIGNGFKALASKGALVAFDRISAGQHLHCVFNFGTHSLNMPLRGRLVQAVNAKQGVGAKRDRLILPPMSGAVIQR